MEEGGDTGECERMVSREEAVLKLVTQHFEVDPFIIRIIWIASERDAPPDEPIKLLEVDDASFGSDKVEPFTFRPSAGYPYLFAIALVSPEDLARVYETPGKLPEGWDLAKARVFERPAGEHGQPAEPGRGPQERSFDGGMILAGRSQEVEPMTQRRKASKEEAVQELVSWHFSIAPNVKKIYWIVTDDENLPEEPIKLLEVDESTITTGDVQAFNFAGTEEIPYSMTIALISPDELKKIEAKAIPLPDGWRLETARVFERSA